MPQRIIRFAPNFSKYLIQYGWIVPGLKGNLDVSYKTIPMEVEVKHQIDIDETMAKIFYHNASDEDEIVSVESSFIKSPHGDKPN